MQTPVRFKGLIFGSALVILGAIVAGWLIPELALAQGTGATVVQEPDAIIFEPEVPLPNFLGGPVTAETFAEYIRAVFVYFIWIVGALAVVMVIYGGIKWVTASGNPGRINDARDVINNALIGLVIALTSIVLLNLISPRLTNFQGLTLTTVAGNVLEYSRAVVEQVGGIQSCPSSQVSGSPEYVGSKLGWEKELNTYINQAASAYGVDPFLIKAIILQESPKQTDPDGGSSPYSGPTTLPDGTGSGRLGSAYGVGQYVADTLLYLLQQVNGRIPSACPTGAAARQASGSLVQSCADWLDARLSLQVRMTARYLQEMSNKFCVKGDLGLTAAGYHVGAGNLQNYCQGEALRFVSVADVVNYVSGIKRRYEQVCAQSPRDFHFRAPPPR